MDIELMKVERQSGMTFREIGEKHGVNASTVMRALKKDLKQSIDVESIVTNQVYRLATRPEGVKQKDEYVIYSSAFEHDEVVEARKRVRAKVRYRAEQEGKQALFIPDWVDTTHPQDSYNSLLVLAHDLNERLEEAVLAYMQETKIDDATSIRSALCQMAIPGYGYKSASTVCEQWSAMIETLQSNMDDVDRGNDNPDTRY